MLPLLLDRHQGYAPYPRRPHSLRRSDVERPDGTVRRAVCAPGHRSGRRGERARRRALRRARTGPRTYSPVCVSFFLLILYPGPPVAASAAPANCRRLERRPVGRRAERARAPQGHQSPAPPLCDLHEVAEPTAHARCRYEVHSLTDAHVFGTALGQAAFSSAFHSLMHPAFSRLPRFLFSRVVSFPAFSLFSRCLVSRDSSFLGFSLFPRFFVFLWHSAVPHRAGDHGAGGGPGPPGRPLEQVDDHDHLFVHAAVVRLGDRLLASTGALRDLHPVDAHARHRRRLGAPRLPHLQDRSPAHLPSGPSQTTTTEGGGPRGRSDTRHGRTCGDRRSAWNFTGLWLPRLPNVCGVAVRNLRRADRPSGGASP